MHATANETGRPEHYLDPAVIEDYDRRYRSGLGRWKHRRKVRVLRGWLEGSESVLEVACGPGRFEEVLRGKRAVALDRSPGMLREYRRRHSAPPRVAADAAQLPFADGSFEAVFTIRFVSHLRGEYRRRVLAEMARVSRCWVILDARHVYNLRYLSRWLRRRLGLAHADKLRHTYHELEEELHAAGLELVARRSVAWGLSGRALLLARRSTDNLRTPCTSVNPR